MTNRITLPQFHAVRKMLAARLRHCEIARETGLSVWTISRIAGDLARQRNTNPQRQRGSAAQARHAEGVGSQLRSNVGDMENGSPQLTPDPLPADLPEDDAPPEYDALQLRRCTGCGGMVYQWPCRTCLLRSHGQPVVRS
jgi:hypothetical protein